MRRKHLLLYTVCQRDPFGVLRVTHVRQGEMWALRQRALTPGCQRKEGKFRLKPKGQGEDKFPGL